MSGVGSLPFLSIDSLVEVEWIAKNQWKSINKPLNGTVYELLPRPCMYLDKYAYTRSTKPTDNVCFT